MEIRNGVVKDGRILRKIYHGFCIFFVPFLTSPPPPFFYFLLSFHFHIYLLLSTFHFLSTLFPAPPPFSLCFAKLILYSFLDLYCPSCRETSGRKRHDFYCFCCRGGVDGDGNVDVAVGGGKCCCFRSCSCRWDVLAYHHTRRLGVSQSSSASWTATKNTLYHLNTQTLVKSWSEFQEGK